MKAIVYHNYGPPDVLEIAEIEKPVIGDDDVLIKVEAASVNPFDWHFLRGTPFPVRFMAGLLKPKNPVLGVDVAGRVAAVGKNASRFQPGDEVFGSGMLGGFAEYARVPESHLVEKPTNLSFVEAAAVPVAAITALQGLRDRGQIQSGQKVLIYGASGGVGTFAVQIAKSFGTEVTAVCSTRNLELVRSIGADQAIDYTNEDFAQSGQRYDLIFDTVGKRSFSDSRRAMNPHGVFVAMDFSLGGMLISRTTSQKMVLMGMAKIVQKDLVFLQELLADGRIKPVIDRTYALNEVPEAIRYLETERARGKVVIAM